jgi:hypothetical protein
LPLPTTGDLVIGTRPGRGTPRSAVNVDGAGVVEAVDTEDLKSEFLFLEIRKKAYQ